MCSPVLQITSYVIPVCKLVAKDSSISHTVIVRKWLWLLWNTALRHWKWCCLCWWRGLISVDTPESSSDLVDCPVSSLWGSPVWVSTRTCSTLPNFFIFSFFRFLHFNINQLMLYPSESVSTKTCSFGSSTFLFIATTRRTNTFNYLYNARILQASYIYTILQNKDWNTFVCRIPCTILFVRVCKERERDDKVQFV